MHRIFASTAVRMAVNLLIGIVGVVELSQGELMGWIFVGSSGALIALRILSVRLRRWQGELVASEAARRAEPGYVAPVIDPGELSRRRTRYVKIIVLAFIGPLIAVGIAATWIALVSTSYLQACAVGIAFAMLLSAGVTIRGLRRGLRKIRDNG
jgi:hypothetical protein